MNGLPGAHDFYGQIFGYDPRENERATVLYTYSIK
jgi:hypothetical protein